MMLNRTQIILRTILVQHSFRLLQLNWLRLISLDDLILCLIFCLLPLITPMLLLLFLPNLVRHIFVEFDLHFKSVRVTAIATVFATAATVPFLQSIEVSRLDSKILLTLCKTIHVSRGHQWVLFTVQSARQLHLFSLFDLILCFN